eukprot:15362061-Alexandrium_andersonii.AAC.1
MLSGAQRAARSPKLARRLDTLIAQGDRAGALTPAINCARMRVSALPCAQTRSARATSARAARSGTLGAGNACAGTLRAGSALDTDGLVQERSGLKAL